MQFSYLTNVPQDLEDFGGLHMKYGVEPDMAMYGKAQEMVMQLQQLLAKKKSWKLLKIPL